MGDAIDLVGYFAFFWLFLFSKKFRETRIADWRSGGLIERFFMTIESLISFLIGVILPIYLISTLVQ